MSSSPIRVVFGLSDYNTLNTISWSNSTIYIKVNKSFNAKEVSVYTSINHSETWNTYDAVCVDKENDFQLWKAYITTNSLLGIESGDITFTAYALSESGEKVWDNNNSANFELPKLLGGCLYNNENVFSTVEIMNSSSGVINVSSLVAINTNAKIKNKVFKTGLPIEIVYTLNHWETSDMLHPEYKSSISLSADDENNMIENPNSRGVEIRKGTFTIETKIDKPENFIYTLCIKCDNNDVYWDNNYGKNYVVPINKIGDITNLLSTLMKEMSKMNKSNETETANENPQFDKMLETLLQEFTKSLS